METRPRRRCEAKRGRSLSRTPLYDLSNALPSSSPSIPKPKPKRMPPVSHSPPTDTVSAGSCSGVGPTAGAEPRVEVTGPHDGGQKISAGHLERFVATMMNSNCSPAEGTKSDIRDENDMDGPNVLTQKLSAPCQKQKKKKLHHKSETQELTEYINKQRAYFAEIDAFELSEEIVSETYLE